MYDDQSITPPQLPTEPDAAETNETEPFNSSSPAISVIIPLYNAEDYLGECIDGILAQTFQDFELIIVDDCSTDSSCEIVESYIPKFDGRLKLYHTPKNTGSGVIARNIGISYASGKYIYSMDNDDLITKTALEEMYTLAKEYDADVVYCEKYYMSSGTGEDFVKNASIATRKIQNPPFVDEPTLESEDLSERVQDIVNTKFWVPPWQKLVRRDLLEEHKITFPVLKIGDDDIWTYALIFFAKKILRVPNMIYIRRMREDSLSEVKRNPQRTMYFWLNPILLGLKTLDNFMERIDFFKENPKQRYAVLEKFFYGKLRNAFENANHLTRAEVYEAIRNEFGDNLGEYDVLISCLCARLFEENKNILTGCLKLEQTKLIQENQKLLAEKDAEIRILRAALAFQMSLLPQASYAISVIIPLYNTAEYIGECLESLLIQTFQDFEVIVVDDCSTDNSVAIVESYRPKFNGRLTLTKTEKNSGGGGYVPRNVGFKLAKGKYVYFADADDFLLGSALETFYKTAEENEVDVIYTAIRYELMKPNDLRVSKDNKKENFVSRILEDKEFDEFLQGLFFKDNFSQPWVYFVRREFLLQNSIIFPEILKAGDYLWAVNICCQVKKIFKLTKPLYFYRRYNLNSVSQITANSNPVKWISAFADFVKALNELAGKTKFLIDNPKYVYAIASRYFKVIFNNIVKPHKLLSNQEIYENLYYDFISNPSDLMVPFFVSTINTQQKELTGAQEIFHKFKPYLTARIDIKFASTNGDLQILSVSDDKAEISKPQWFNKNGVGYLIHSLNGTLTFISKATVDGQINLSLKGMDVRDPKDQTKRIPYWIDYTKLTVNGKTIFNTLKPTWHDKYYRHNIKIKAGEELTINVEWQPHRADTIEQPLPPKPKAVAPPKFETARVDVKLQSTEGDFQILSVSDDKAKVIKPKRLQDNGVGYVLTSSAGKLTFAAKATADGQIDLKLRGMDRRDPKDQTKRIPKWVDYTKLIINDKTIFDTLTPTWHNKPYFYKANIKKDEEIKIQLEWQPRKKDT